MRRRPRMIRICSTIPVALCELVGLVGLHTNLYYRAAFARLRETTGCLSSRAAWQLLNGEEQRCVSSFPRVSVYFIQFPNSAHSLHAPSVCLKSVELSSEKRNCFNCKAVICCSSYPVSSRNTVCRSLPFSPIPYRLSSILEFLPVIQCAWPSVYLVLISSNYKCLAWSDRGLLSGLDILSFLFGQSPITSRIGY